MGKSYVFGLLVAFLAGLWIGSLVTYLVIQAGRPEPGAPPKRFAEADVLTVCSFNVQFLGQSKERDAPGLASILRDYDVVVIQELTAPPYPGTFPGGEPFVPDRESARFFDAMRGYGFEYVLSEENTGTGERIHRNSTTAEWWVAFYRPDRVAVAADLPKGFLAEDRSNHADYERVPYAFPFRSADGKCDFVLVSVHLKPGTGPDNRARRKNELLSISAWVHTRDEVEKDFLIVGDMNIENSKELAEATPLGFLSLNDECRPTNTNVKGPRPYDHVLFRPDFTTEIDRQFDLVVVNLIEAMRPHWTGPEPYPGDPYDHNRFRKYYSDHHPVVFRLMVPDQDDD